MAKRILSFLLVLVLALSLCACSSIKELFGDTSDDPAVGDGTSYSDFMEVMGDIKKYGVDISFGADGSMTVVDEDATTMVQKPDGTWEIKDEEGNEGQIGGERLI